MAEYTSPESYQYEAPPVEKKSNKTLIIILVIVGVLLLCCCIAAVIGIVAWLVSSGELGQLMPLMLGLI